MHRLNGKIAIITGAAQGMGEAHARKFIEEGAKVVLTDVNPQAEKLADSLGKNALYIKHDVRSLEQWTAVVAQTEARFGAPNVLINNAGVIGPVASLHEFSEASFLDVCAVNQLGVFLGMKAVVPAMTRKSAGGSIVNVSSIAGLLGIPESPNFAYVASKFAVRGMTKYAAVTLGPQNIRVNSVHPGWIKTPMMVAATDADGAPRIVSRYADTPIR